MEVASIQINVHTEGGLLHIITVKKEWRCFNAQWYEQVAEGNTAQTPNGERITLQLYVTSTVPLVFKSLKVHLSLLMDSHGLNL